MYIVTIFLLIIILLTLYTAYVLFSHYNFLSNKDYEMSQKYNSYENFRSTLKVIVKFYLKKVNKYYRFFTHYISLLFIKLVKFLQSLFQNFYKKLINSFLEKSIENKTYVKFFWKDLKKFKKEIDSENDL